jgi:sugar lactone lactonase YvrE
MSAAAIVPTGVRDMVGESPVWSVAEQALYWVDIEGRQIRRHDWAQGTTRSVPTPERVGCIALGPQGGLIAAMETGIFSLQGLATGQTPTFTLLYEARHPAAGMRFNDGRCDPAGRFWVGTMVMDMALASAQGSLYRVAGEPSPENRPAPLPEPVLGNLMVPNGLAFSPDGRRLYLSDSHPMVQSIWCFDFDLATGEAANKRLFVDMRHHPGRPDGAAVDEDGCYWSCANDAGLVHRFTPDGRLDRSIALPVSKPSMCAFAGPRLDVLAVTSITPGRPAPTHPDDALVAGSVFLVDAGTRGIPEPTFAPASG